MAHFFASNWESKAKETILLFSIVELNFFFAIAIDDDDVELVGAKKRGIIVQEKSVA